MGEVEDLSRSVLEDQVQEAEDDLNQAMAKATALEERISSNEKKKVMK